MITSSHLASNAVFRKLASLLPVLTGILKRLRFPLPFSPSRLRRQFPAVCQHGRLCVLLSSRCRPLTSKSAPNIVTDSVRSSLCIVTIISKRTRILLPAHTCVDTLRESRVHQSIKTQRPDKNRISTRPVKAVGSCAMSCHFLSILGFGIGISKEICRSQWT